MLERNISVVSMIGKVTLIKCIVDHNLQCGQIFKEEIERTDQPGGPILDSQDVKAIFGGIPSIYDVHIKIRDELSEMISRWSDDESVGNIFLRHVSICSL